MSTPSTHPSLHPHRILIAEHEDSLRSLYSIILNGAGYRHTKTAGNGQKALEEVVAFQPHLVLVSYSLPLTSGVQLTRHLRDCYPRIKSILISGYDMTKEAKEAGADECLAHPFMPAKLIQTIKNLLHTSEEIRKEY